MEAYLAGVDFDALRAEAGAGDARVLEVQGCPYPKCARQRLAVANQCVGVLCTAARERKAATEASAHKEMDDAAHSSFKDLCALKVLSVAAASELIFGEGEDADSKRLRSACKTWAYRCKSYSSSLAVKEAAKKVRARLFPPASRSRLMLLPPH